MTAETAEIIQLSVRETKHGSDPEYIIAGDDASVQAYVDDLLRRYPPAGYGTHITSDVTDLGVRTVRMTRYHSSD
jgi:hypothetical protein